MEQNPCGSTKIRPHVRQVRNISGGKPRDHLLVIGFIVEQLEIDVDVRIRLFEGSNDAQPVDAFRIRVVAVGHGLHHDFGRSRR
jgi:hypothetical protein